MSRSTRPTDTERQSVKRYGDFHGDLNSQQKLFKPSNAIGVACYPLQYAAKLFVSLLHLSLGCSPLVRVPCYALSSTEICMIVSLPPAFSLDCWTLYDLDDSVTHSAVEHSPAGIARISWRFWRLNEKSCECVIGTSVFMRIPSTCPRSVK